MYVTINNKAPQLFKVDGRRANQRYLGQFFNSLQRQQLNFDINANINMANVSNYSLNEIDSITLNVANDADTEIKTLKGQILSTPLNFVRKMIKVNATYNDFEGLSEVVFQGLNKYLTIFDKNILDGNLNPSNPTGAGTRGLLSVDNGTVIAGTITTYSQLQSAIQSAVDSIRTSLNLSTQQIIKVYLSGTYFNLWRDFVTSATNPNTPAIVADLYKYSVEPINSGLSAGRNLIIALSPENTTYYYGVAPQVLFEGTSGNNPYIDNRYALLGMTNASVIALNKHIQYKIG